MMTQKDHFGNLSLFCSYHTMVRISPWWSCFLLPRSREGLRKLKRKLKLKLFKQLNKKIQQLKVNVVLPKFRIEYSKSMKGTLLGLGLSRVFRSGADFSGMSDSKLLNASDVIHKTVVEVNEQGCQAAATAASGFASFCKEHIWHFVVDHPFLFTIYDTKNDIILFLGRVKEL